MKNSSKKKIENAQAKANPEASIQSFHKEAPMTRREFLSRGLVAGSGMIVAPSALSLLSNAAWGQESGIICPAPALNTRVKTITVDLAGGWNSTGANFMAGGEGGQMDFLADYTRFGIPAASHPSGAGMVNDEFGIKMYEFSAFLAGLKSVTSVAARACVDGIVAGGVSNDDTNTNPHNASAGFCAAGSAGAFAYAAGSRAGGSGGNSTFANFSYKAAFAANQVSNINQLLSFVQAGLLATRLGANKAKAIFESASRVSDRQIAALSSQSLPDQYKSLISCGYGDAKSLPDRYTVAQVDPRNDPDFQAVFGTVGLPANQQNFGNNADGERTAAVVAGVLGSYFTHGTISDGGYDYHGNARAATDPTDFRAGRIVGKIIEMAYRKNQKVMIQLVSDGAISCGTTVEQVGKLDNNGAQTGTQIGKTQAAGDNGNFGAQIFLVVNGQTPRSVLSIVKSNPIAQGRQVSAFRDRGVDTNSSLIANNNLNLTRLAYASWASLNGEESTIASVTGDEPFSTSSNPNKYFLFNKIT